MCLVNDKQSTFKLVSGNADLSSVRPERRLLVIEVYCLSIQFLSSCPVIGLECFIALILQSNCRVCHVRVYQEPLQL